MRGKFQDELWYEIVPIRLDPSRDWLCNLMILQLPFLLDASFNKHIIFEIIALFMEKKPLKPSRKLRKKLCV